MPFFTLAVKVNIAIAIVILRQMLILLDLKLPRRSSGHEILSWLRQQLSLKRLPVIMLTSSKENMDINQAYDLGANSYLVKPVGLTALV